MCSARANNQKQNQAIAAIQRTEAYEMGAFFEQNRQMLDDYARMSQLTGARADYVQGGGGNTSVKINGRQMAVKASGFRLSDVTPQNAYAVMDFSELRAFYRSNEPRMFEDVEKAGSQEAKKATLLIDGLPQLRPSVEAGFHSLLGTFVIHSHSVYANLACCALGLSFVAGNIRDPQSQRICKFSLLRA